jgi:hypothetical protein
MLSQQRKNTFYVLTLVALAGTLLLNAHPAFAQVSVSSSGSVSLSSGGGALFSSGTNFLSALQTVLTSSSAAFQCTSPCQSSAASFWFSARLLLSMASRGACKAHGGRS